MRTALAFLNLLVERLPPPQGANHGLLYNQERSHLMVAVAVADGKFQSFGLDDDDLDKTPDWLVDEIIALMAEINKRAQ